MSKVFTCHRNKIQLIKTTIFELRKINYYLSSDYSYFSSPRIIIIKSIDTELTTAINPLNQSIEQQTNPMNTLTPRQYLIQISLISLACPPSSQVSKALCELHYGQSYTRFKTHPQIASNGVAQFRRETICVPYTDDIALVFKKMTSSRNELFLGHYQIEVEEFLEQKVYFIEMSEKLVETQTFVNFECRIIDKELFAESETEDLSQCESVMRRSQYSTLDEDPINVMRRYSLKDSHSEYNSGHRNPRESSPFQRSVQVFNREEFSCLLPEEFGKKLCLVDEIIKKKNLLRNQQAKLGSFGRNRKGELKSEKIQKLENLMKDKKEECIFNTLMIYVAVVMASLFVGVVAS